MLEVPGLSRFACAIRHVPLLLVALAGCKKSGPGPVENTVVEPPAAMTVDEVTPALIAELAEGTRVPRALVDPARGLYEVTAEASERRCDRDAEQAITQIAQAMKRAEVEGAEYEEYVIACAEDEDFARSTWCVSSGAGESAPNYHVLFVTNAAGAVHLGGILVWDNGGNPDPLFEELIAEALEDDAPCGG